MEVVDTTQINSFLPEQRADFVPPSEEAVFILNSGQLSSLITKAIEKAIQPLSDRISSLEDRTASLEEENAAMRLKLASLESTQEQDTTRICLDIAYDRQRISRLEKVEPQPLQKDRGEILRALLAANGGKMLAKDARQKMHLTKQTFSMLIASMNEYIEIKPLHSDKRKDVLMLK
jgi:hypothetical protein